MQPLTLSPNNSLLRWLEKIRTSFWKDIMTLLLFSKWCCNSCEHLQWVGGTIRGKDTYSVVKTSLFLKRSTSLDVYSKLFWYLPWVPFYMFCVAVFGVSKCFWSVEVPGSVVFCRASLVLPVKMEFDILGVSPLDLVLLCCW